MREAWQDEKVRLVMSTPGIDYTVAQTCLAANRRHLAFRERQETERVSGVESFDAAVRRTLLSRENHQTGKCPCAVAVGASGAAFGAVSRAAGTDHAEDREEEKNRSVAVVACARKLAVLLWHRAEFGRTASLRATKSLQAKYARLRVRATGQRRRGGTPQGIPRSTQYGHGRTRAVPSLLQVLVANGLPEIALLAKGERVKESCWNERDWISSTANYKSLFAFRPTPEPRKWKKLKRISNLS